MQGIIVNFDSEKNLGIIRGEDGLRYQFTSDEWRETKVYPAKNIWVDFDSVDDNAMEIYVLLKEKNREEQNTKKYQSKIYVAFASIAVFLMFLNSVFSILVFSRINNIPLAEARIKDYSKNPNATQFRNVENFPNGVVCGEVNLPNEYGGYIGFQKFAYWTILNTDMTGTVIPNESYQRAVELLESAGISDTSGLYKYFTPENYEILCTKSKANAYSYFRPICNYYADVLAEQDKKIEEIKLPRENLQDEQYYQSRLNSLKEAREKYVNVKNTMCLAAFNFGKNVEGMSIQELEWVKSIPNYDESSNKYDELSRYFGDNLEEESRLKIMDRIEDNNIQINEIDKELNLR